jgi:RNA-directed DNA polymerase
MTNVTEHPATDWNVINWRTAHRKVVNLRQRIFRASREGNLKKVRSLQKLMLRSYSNTLVGVRRVTQENHGKNTPGVDKLLVKTPERRAWLVDYLMTFQPWKAKPNRRVYIPKANGKLRPLGIPSITDRAIQARVKNALEPFWEARFEGSSYGFRPGRSCHDAIQKIYLVTASPTHKRGEWVADADIKGAFDNISHDFLLSAIGNFPARELIRQWLKAGYVAKDVFYDTDKGTPQGGVISPLLANIALDGMEKRLTAQGQKRTVVRYADDFVILCTTREDAAQALTEFSPWLKERGLVYSVDKTRIVHITEGFDFLGWNVRKYDSTKGTRLLIRPSKDSVKRVVDKIRNEWVKGVGRKPLNKLIPAMNRIICGWSNYHRHIVAKDTFRKLDCWMFKREQRYAARKHKDKSWQWRAERYWGKFLQNRNDNWTFGDKQTGQYIWKFAWTKIKRHVMVKGTASPDDPDLKTYWQNRTKGQTEDLWSKKWREIAKRQNGLCLRCGGNLINEEEIQQHHINPDGGEEVNNLELVHLYCHQQISARQATMRAHERRQATRRKQ